MRLLTISTPRPVMPATKVASDRQSREKIADRSCRRDKTLGFLTSAAATVPTSHCLHLQAPRCPFKKMHRWNNIRSPPQFTVGAYAVLFCTRTLAYRTLAKALPNGRSSAPPSRRSARAPSTPANSTQIFISIVPVAGPAPSLEERIRVTSNIGGVHSLKAHSFNQPYRRIEKSRPPRMEFAHGL